jgi:site-specific DNA-methyltransferase (adenine-specific)
MNIGCPKEICDKCGKPKVKKLEVKQNNPRYQPTCKCNTSFSPGIVLDPFCGSGTTCLVAKKLNRQYIGIEISPTYTKMARKRLALHPTINEWLQ